MSLPDKLLAGWKRRKSRLKQGEKPKWAYLTSS